MGEIFEKTVVSSPLAWTGERLTTEAGPQVEIEHLHRYFLARSLCRGLDVLDVASGEGYGSALLAQTARSVVGVELDAESVAHAQVTYSAPNLKFIHGDALDLPLADASVDLVVSFETIEHFYDHDRFLSEVRRVLRPSGRFVVSSPERDVYSPVGAPPNPHHVRELTRIQFLTLLRQYFEYVLMQGQRPMLGSVLVTEGPRTAGEFGTPLTFERRGPNRFEGSDGLARPVYLVAVASNTRLENIPDSLYIESSAIEEALVELPQTRDELERTKIAFAAAGDYARNLEAKIGRINFALETEIDHSRNLNSDLAYAKALCVKLTNRINSLSSELDAILVSSSWRLTRPLRQVFGRHQWAALALRRAAKLLWWTATLQLLGRIAARRRDTKVGNAVPVSSSSVMEVSIPNSKSVAAPASGAVPLVTPSNPEAIEKHSLDAAARAELIEFLLSGERLVVPQHENPEVSVVVVLWNKAHLTLRCIRALLDQAGPSLELVLLDNASGDETAELLSRIDGGRILVSASNEGFVIGCNKAVVPSRGRVVLLLNNDAFVRPGAIAAALATLDADPATGAVGARLILPTGRIQEGGSIVWSDASALGYGRGLPPDAGEIMYRRDVDYCSGAFLLTPRSLWDRLGGFDEGFAPAYYEDADYCMRLHDLGYRVVYEPSAAVDHYEFGSEERRGDAAVLMRRNRKRFRLLHAESLRRRHFASAEANVLAARQRNKPGPGRLLVIDNELPLSELGSGYPRMRRLLAEAVALDWEVTFFPLYRPHVDWLKARSEVSWEIEVASGLGAPELSSFLTSRQGYYDVILVSRPNNMELVSAAWRDRRYIVDGCRIVYDAEALFCTRDIVKAAVEGLPTPDAADLIAKEVRLANEADSIICVTPAEAAIFWARLPTPVHTLSHPTQVRTDTPSFADRSGFLFVGRLLEQETPNWDGLAWFIRECWPSIRLVLPDVTLLVAGHLHSSHAELEAPGVELLGAVQDLEPLYDKAKVFIAPVRFAAGIPIKILDATAAGLPTVGTNLMAQQLDWTSGVEMLAEDEPTAFVTAALDLYDDATKWACLRDAAQERVRRDHSAESFRMMLKTILDGGVPPTAGATPTV